MMYMISSAVKSVTTSAWPAVEVLKNTNRSLPAPPVIVAAAAERGAAADERLRVESARLAVVGNATLLDKQTRLAQNQDFIASTLNWMLNRERLIGVTPKPKGQYRVQLTEKQHRLLFWITALCAPGIVLLFGVSVWAGRRAS